MTTKASALAPLAAMLALGAGAAWARDAGPIAPRPPEGQGRARPETSQEPQQSAPQAGAPANDQPGATGEQQSPGEPRASGARQPRRTPQPPTEDEAAQAAPESRAVLGIDGETLTPERADALGTITRNGVLVEKVAPRGPAARAGLMAGDVIIGIDFAPIPDTEELGYQLSLLDPGRRVAVQFVRNGITAVTAAALAEAKAAAKRSR